jgi:uncharacterized protein (TIGR00730 family)
MANNSKIISIFGSSKGTDGEEMFDAAYNIGRLLTENGFVVANGGYGGLMLASSKGAADSGGKAIGVTCAAFKRSMPNEYITEEIGTEVLQKRLEKLVEIADGYVVMPGGTGTLLELAHVWEFQNKHFIKEDKPIILYSDFWKPLVEMIGSIDAKSVQCLEIAETAEQVVGLLYDRLGK